MLKRSTKIIVGSSAALVCALPLICGTHKFFSCGGLKIDPDELYFDDKEVEKIKRQARQCHSGADNVASKKVACENCDEAKPQKEEKREADEPKEPKTGPTETEVVSLLTEIAPDNQKFCDAVVDIVNAAFTNLECKQRNKLLHSLFNILDEFIDDSEPENECKQENLDKQIDMELQFDGKNFLNKNGELMSDGDVRKILTDTKKLSVDLSEAVTSLDTDKCFAKIVEDIFSFNNKDSKFDPVKLVRTLFETKN